MKIGVLGEKSGVIRDAFISREHDAISCDLLPTQSQGPHIQGDYLKQDWSGYDLLIAHPDCTYLCSSGLHWNRRRPERAALTEQAIQHVRTLMNMLTDSGAAWALENPIGCISTRIRKPDQTIQPHQFGDDASKATCLWLHKLPMLTPTEHIPPRIVDGKKRWGNQTDSGQNRLGPSEQRAAMRAQTYPGIARAMADQWGKSLAEHRIPGVVNAEPRE